MNELTKSILNQRGEEGIGVLIVLGFIIAVVLWLFGFNFGAVNEGVIKYDDCREIITIKSDSWRKYFHKFTCTTRKTNSGVVMGGECASVKYDSSLFGGNNACATAYVYELDTPTSCKGNTKEGIAYPYLGYDDMCHTTPQ